MLVEIKQLMYLIMSEMENEKKLFSCLVILVCSARLQRPVGGEMQQVFFQGVRLLQGSFFPICGSGSEQEEDGLQDGTSDFFPSCPSQPLF